MIFKMFFKEVLTLLILYRRLNDGSDFHNVPQFKKVGFGPVIELTIGQEILNSLADIQITNKTTKQKYFSIEDTDTASSLQDHYDTELSLLTEH